MATAQSEQNNLLPASCQQGRPQCWSTHPPLQSPTSCMASLSMCTFSHHATAAPHAPLPAQAPQNDSFSTLQRIACAISDTMRSPVASCCRAVQALARPAGVPAHTWRPALRLCQAGRGHRITCKAAPPFHSLTQPFHTLTQHDAYCKVNLHERQGRPPERPLPKRPQPSTGVAPAPASVAVAPDRRPAGRQCRQRMPRQAHNHLARVNHSFVCAAMVQHMPRKQKTCNHLQLAQLR